jgi:hypothetical protein
LLVAAAVTWLQLEHIIRDAAAEAETRELVLIGSPAILGSYTHAPEELLVFVEPAFSQKTPSRFHTHRWRD